MRPPTDHADPIRGSGVQEVVVKNWEETWEVLEYMIHEGTEWDWFCIDSISLLQDVLLDDVFQGLIDRKGGRTGERNRFGPDKGEYGVNMWRLAQLVRYLVGSGAGFNLLITAHSYQREWNDELEEGSTGTPVEKLVPWVQGKMMSEKIAGMMNFVGYMEKRVREVRGEKKLQRVMYVDSNPRYVAKNQFKLSDGSPTIEEGLIIDPTMPALLEKIGRGQLHTPDDRRAGSSRPSGGRPSLGRATRPSGRSTAGRTSGRTTGRST